MLKKIMDFLWEPSTISKGVKHVLQNDYNIYYMPDNHLYTDFMIKTDYIL